MNERDYISDFCTECLPNTLKNYIRKLTEKYQNNRNEIYNKMLERGL